MAEVRYPIIIDFVGPSVIWQDRESFTDFE